MVTVNTNLSPGTNSSNASRSLSFGKSKKSKKKNKAKGKQAPLLNQKIVNKTKKVGKNSRNSVGKFFEKTWKNMTKKRESTFFKNTWKFLGNKYTGWVVAGTTSALTLYNIFKNGIAKGRNRAKEEIGTGYTELFSKTGKSPRYSHLMEGMKDSATNAMFNDPVYPFWKRTKNIVGSTAGEIVNQAGTMLLAVGAVGAPVLINGGKKLANGASKVGTGVSAICTSLLMLKGGKILVADVLGIKKSKM